MPETKKILRDMYRSARNYYETFLEDNNENAFKYFNEEEPAIIDDDVEEYFQQIVSPDVANVIEHTLADIMPAFSTDFPAVFKPMGPQDEVQAMQETAVVNDIFMEQSDGFTKLTTAIKNAFLTRIGVIEVQTYKKKLVEYMELNGVDISILTAIKAQAEQTGESVDIIDINGEMDEDEIGTVLSSTLDATIRKTREVRELYIDAFPTDELLIEQEATSLNLDECNFVARVRLLTRSELITLGYEQEIVEKLPSYATSKQNRPQRQRKDDIQDYMSPQGHEYVETAFMYARIDEDGDGIAELRRIVMAGEIPDGEILSNDVIDQQPFAIGVPFIYPNRVHGISLYDKIKQVQQINTKVIRQILTAGERAIRGRLGIVGNQVNMEDIMRTQFGGLVRLTTPNGIVPIPNDPFPSDILSLLSVTDKRRKESGGSAVDKANEEILVGGDTAHGLERIMSAMEQLNSLVAKNIAETLLRQTYRKIHHNLRTYFNQPISAKVGGNWIAAVPTTWPARQYVKVSLGLTMGDRLRQAAAYEKMILDHKDLQQTGSILVNDRNLYRLMVNRANALMIPNAESYYTDPMSPEGQQAAQMKQQQMQQEMQRQEQMNIAQQTLLQQVEIIKGQNAVEVQNLRNRIKEIELLMKQIEQEKDRGVKYDEMKLKLVELNAQYDQEEVPNALPRK